VASDSAINKISVLQNKDFIIYWIGIIMSNFGNAISTFVFPLMILELTNNPFHLGAVGALSLIPYAVLGLPAGVLIDKLDRKLIMKITDLIRFLSYITIPVSFYLGVMSIAQIYIVSLISGFCLVFHSISEVSSTPSIVQKEQLPQANSLIYSTQNIMEFIGPAIGGFLYSLIGYPILIGFDALTFLISFITLTIIKSNFQEKIQKGKKLSINIYSDMVEGLKYLLNHKKIRSMLIIIATTNVIVSPYYIYIILFAKETLQVNPENLGLIFGFSSIGALLGSLSSGKLGTKIPFGSLIFFIVIIDVTSRIVLPFSFNIYILILLMALTYATQAIINLTIITYRQSIVPSQLLGRVNSAFRTIVFSTRPLGLFLGGLLVEGYSGFTALFISGLLLITVIFITYFSGITKNTNTNI